MGEVGDMGGVKYGNICKIEKGKYNVSVDIIERIWWVVGVRVKVDRVNSVEELGE